MAAAFIATVHHKTCREFELLAIMRSSAHLPPTDTRAYCSSLRHASQDLAGTPALHATLMSLQASVSCD